MKTAIRRFTRCILPCVLLLITACQTSSLAPAGSSDSPLSESISPASETVQATPLAEPELLPVDEPESSPEPVAVSQPVDLWQRIRDGFALDHQTHRKQVQREIQWYAKHPDYIQRVVDRAEPFLFYIVEQLEEHNLPLEFALLPVVESAFDPFAYSHGRASGLWQFIPATARMHGVRIDWWYDGRRDVIDSTEAAATYLHHLYKRLDDDWPLALAAYNSGEGNVRGALRRNKKSREFWHLKLPRETTSYVPRLLAISAVIDNPSKYGLTLRSLPNQQKWELVDIQSQLDLVKAAQLAEMPSRDLYKLNAGFNQWATHPEGPHRLLLPQANRDRFLKNLAALPLEERMTWTRHTIRSGETLGLIAEKYRTSVATLRSVNNIRGTMIRAGDSMLIPMASSTTDYTMTADARLREKQANIEKQIGTKPIEYRIQRGDSLWKISRIYGVTVRQLANWNSIGTGTLLQPGDSLKVFSTRRAVHSNPTVPTSVASVQDVVRKVNYRVRKGESLARIASKFNLSVNNIREWNQETASARYLQPGDRLTLYVDVTATE
jgi:membrane-bound lytic murein transglycosylase D